MDMTDFNLEHNTSYDSYELDCIASQKFSDAWIFVNGRDLGTWELPCKVPILEEGTPNILIFPGVKMNGVSTSRPRYPFADAKPLRDANGRPIELRKDAVTTIDRVPVRYYSTTNFSNVIETFETISNQYFEAVDSAGLNFQRIQDPGPDYTNPNHVVNHVGTLTLGNGDSVFNIQSRNLAFNRLPEAVFLEMDYRCDAPENHTFNVGMFIEKSITSVTSYEPLVVVKASNEWKKIYINLTQSVLRNQTYATAYRVLLSGGQSGDEPVTFYFDNIKIVYQ